MNKIYKDNLLWKLKNPISSTGSNFSFAMLILICLENENKKTI